MQDARAADEVEARIGELELLGVHHAKLETIVEALAATLLRGLFDRHRRDVDADDMRALARQPERAAAGTAAVLQGARAVGERGQLA